MPKLEDILKAKGYADADIAALAPMLSDARFRSTLEDTYGVLESERDSLKSLNADWQRKLDEDYNPAITRAQKEMETARLEAARLRETVKIAKDFGYLTDETVAPPVPDPNAPKPFDAKLHKVVTYDDIGRLADQEGEAIAMAYDLGAEYSALYGGKSLIEYQGADGARGMRALRQEAKVARKNLDVYVAEKFNFSGKRTEADATRQKAHDDSIRSEERSKVAAELGNPALR